MASKDDNSDIECVKNPGNLSLVRSLYIKIGYAYKSFTRVEVLRFLYRVAFRASGLWSYA
jgi:hypothetical protein